MREEVCEFRFLSVFELKPIVKNNVTSNKTPAVALRGGLNPLLHRWESLGQGVEAQDGDKKANQKVITLSASPMSS